MVSLAQKLKNKLSGSILGAGSQPVVSSAPIRNFRGPLFSSSDPFATTEDNKFAYGTLRYPEDVGSAEYGHYLLFHIYETQQSRYAGNQTESTSLDQGFEEGQVDPKLAQAAGNKQDTFQKKEHSLYSPSIAYESGDQVTALKRNNQGKSISGSLRASGKLKRTTDSIALYLPNNIQANYGANYKKSETGLAGVIGADLIGSRNVGDLLSRIGTEGTFNTIRDALIDTLGVKATTAVADLVTGGDLEGVVRKGTSRALNPALEAIFQNVDFRTFNYSFRFIPRSENELKQIDAIIKLFKFHMLPERVQGQKIGTHLIFPSEFDIQYMYQDQENRWYPFVTGCVLEKMDVSYGPGGESQHIRPIDGSPAPTEINMNLQFSETEIMTKEKIVEGF